MDWTSLIIIIVLAVWLISDNWADAWVKRTKIEHECHHCHPTPADTTQEKEVI